MDKNLTILSPLPQDFIDSMRAKGYLPCEWITKEEAKLIWPDRPKLSKKGE